MDKLPSHITVKNILRSFPVDIYIYICISTDIYICIYTHIYMLGLGFICSNLNQVGVSLLCGIFFSAPANPKQRQR